MPKQTFFNLTDEKRRHITEAAVRHFAQHGYKLASITQLVAEAGIAKGSFYQYFEDKDDLFIYLIGLISERKQAVYRREFHTLEELSLTEYLRKVFHHQLEEFRREPELMAVGLELSRIYNEPVVQRIANELGGLRDTIFLDYIADEKKRGEIDPKVDDRLLNFMIVGLGNYIASRLISQPDAELSDEFIDDVTDKLEYILTHGIYSGTHKAPQ